LLKLNKIDKAVINARLSGDAICDIRKEELSVLADVAIFKIAAIAGLSLPTSDKFADVLNEELLILLTEFGYTDITFEELVLAFRINYQHYRTSGGHVFQPIIPYSTFFSINYASAVLDNYKSIRQIIERKIVEQVGEDMFDKYKNKI